MPGSTGQSRRSVINLMIVVIFGAILVLIHQISRGEDAGIYRSAECNCTTNLESPFLSSKPLQSAPLNMPPEDFDSTAAFNSPTILMDDTRLVRAVRNMLRAPSTSPTTFTQREYLTPGYNPSAGQVQLIEDILKGLGRDGFFIECGANDGEWYSNTIWVERTLGWKGLLIEADPQAFDKLIQKNRNAWAGHFCLSNTLVPQKLPFFQNGGVMGSLIKSRHHLPTPVDVQCVPLYTVLLAINKTEIEFFSLDIEGSELDVLRTVPFDKVVFKVLTIEHILIKEGKLALKEFMEGKGYLFFKTFTHPGGLAGDSIFIHSSVEINKEQMDRFEIGD